MFDLIGANRRRLIAAVIVVAACLAVAGCGGGGGGNGNSNTATVIGSIFSANGTAMPGVTVSVANGGPSTTSVQSGAYRITGVPLGVITIQASVFANGALYTGSTQVLTVVNGSATTATNTTIVLSPSGAQGAYAGTITDNNGNPLHLARVFLPFPSIQPVTGINSTLAIVAFTDSHGHYLMNNVPAATNQSLTASALGYQNVKQLNLTPSAVNPTVVNFQLSPSGGTGPTVPTIDAVLAFTQPSVALAPSAHVSPATLSSIYSRIRRLASPKYAALSARGHAAASSKKLVLHPNDFGPNAIEVDLYFTESQIGNVVGYGIYSGVGAGASTSPYDFLQDPLANDYIDFDPFYQPNTVYDFQVNAVDSAGAPTSLSAVGTVDPLDAVNLTQPIQNQGMSNPVLVTWDTVTGAASYNIYLFTGYPTAGQSTYATVTGITTNSYLFPNSLPSGTYWMVLAATDTNVVDVSVSNITEFTVS